MTTPTPDAVLEWAHAGNGWYDWLVDGSIIRLRRHQLEPALVSAWDPHDPNWPAQVEAWLEPDDDYSDHPSLSAQDRNPSLHNS